MKTWIVLIVFLFSQFTYAACPDTVQVIEKGQVANCSGLLFSPEAARDVDINQQDLEYYKKLNEQLFKRRDVSIKQMEVMDKRLQLYMDQSHTLATQLHRKEKEDKWQKLMYFGLGVLATGIAVHGASKLAR